MTLSFHKIEGDTGTIYTEDKRECQFRILGSLAGGQQNIKKRNYGHFGTLAANRL